MDSNIQNQLEQTLQSDGRVWVNNDSNETSILAKNILLDLVEKTDPTIIGLLLGNDELKRHFFAEVNGVLVFKLQDFRFFLDKHSINNSYTKYANRIGLTDGNRFLKDSSDIVLDFPFKDCVLNGGQSTEEGEEIYFKRNNDQSDSQLYTKLTQKRQEIFFNQTLAFDEIDRLFDAKAFSKFSRYTANGKQAVGKIKRHSDGFLKGVPAENLIIKGNNLIALHSLAKQFKGKIKLIYIDPPYYFKNKQDNDSFGYNTNYKLSTWLVFMKNRLEIAKTLLSDDGVIFVQIKDDGIYHLKLLLDEIFGIENFVNNISVKMSEATGVKMSHSRMRFPNIKEYILFYKNSSSFSGFTHIDKYETKEWDRENNIFLENLSFEQRQELISYQEKDEISEIDLQKVIKILANVKKVSLNTKLQELDVEDKEQWLFDNSYRIIKTAGSSSIKNQVLALDDVPNQDISALISKKDKVLFFYITDFNREANDPRLRVIFADENIWKNPCDFWQDIKTSGAIAKERGVQLSNGKKPEKLLHRIISMTTKEKDIVLDFFSGSGTTAAVAHKMNRQWITIEQIENQVNLSIQGLTNVINADNTGISELVNWQGGGEFVYAELAPFNETAKQQILACEDSDDIKTLFNELCERYFLKYNVSVNEFSQIIEEPEFQSLPLDEQKQMVLEMLDLNQMYVSLSEMDDEQFAGCLNDDDKALSREFYQSAKNQAEKKDGE